MWSGCADIINIVGESQKCCAVPYQTLGTDTESGGCILVVIVWWSTLSFDTRVKNSRELIFIVWGVQCG